MNRILMFSLALAAVAAPARAQSATQNLQIKYVRDGEEYAALARQSYRVGTQAVSAAARQVRAGSWAVILDVDETSVDNSTFELEQAGYGRAYSEAVWASWVARRAAPPVPGVADFIAAVRRLGGHVAWITDRAGNLADDTRGTLQNDSLWNDDDRLCVKNDSTYTKAVRRAEVASGSGRCSWGQRLTVLAFFGDQITDFPAAGESDPDAGNDAAFGVRYFLLPNPMYGGWTSRRTRK